MFPHHIQQPPEDPGVAAVEGILQTAASRAGGAASRREGRLVVTHAIWLCACETMYSSPVWLIYAWGEDGVGWQRIPSGTHEGNVVQAEHLTGGHPAPGAVLEWLRGDWSDPWRGRVDPPQHAFIYEELRRRIHSS